MSTQLEHLIKDNSNPAFIARFALVIVALHLVVGSFGLAAHGLATRHELHDEAPRAALISERIRTAARVATAGDPAVSADGRSR